MILSKKYKFVYLKGQKVASTSVEMALSSICDSGDIITLMDPIDERRRGELGLPQAQNYSRSRESELEYTRILNETDDPAAANAIQKPKILYGPHIALRRLERLVGKLDDYFIFGVDRNPYAKVISLANMKQSYKSSYMKGGEMKGNEARLGKAIDDVVRKGLKRINNIERYSDAAGNLRAHIIRYENLQEELDALIKERGWPELAKLPHAKKGISAGERDLRTTLTPEQIARINEALSRDFEVNGYEKMSPNLEAS